MAFYYQFVVPNRSFIELDRRLPIEQALNAHLSEYVSMQWEKLCRDAVTGNLVNGVVYGKAKRRKSEYIFCSGTFDDGYKSYYYLTDDDSIEIGDFVLVPAGNDNHEAVVEVVNIEYFSEENVPLPIEKTKRIIRKCTDEDFDLPESEW